MTVTGTVTNADGSPGAGTVQLYVSVPLSLATMQSLKTCPRRQALTHCSCPLPPLARLSEGSCWACHGCDADAATSFQESAAGQPQCLHESHAAGSGSRVLPKRLFTMELVLVPRAHLPVLRGQDCACPCRLPESRSALQSLSGPAAPSPGPSLLPQTAARTWCAPTTRPPARAQQLPAMPRTWW